MMITIKHKDGLVTLKQTQDEGEVEVYNFDINDVLYIEQILNDEDDGSRLNIIFKTGGDEGIINVSYCNKDIIEQTGQQLAQLLHKK